MREILEEKPVSISEVKEILDKIASFEGLEQPDAEPLEEELFDFDETEDTQNYFIKSTYEYSKIFSKLEPEVAKKLISNLVKEEGIPLSLSIQIANVNPDTVEELTLFFEKGSKRLNKEQIQDLLFKIREYKEL
ncbi:MAG: hypothetical protein ACTSUE_04500 [Promethearchaeota archaeon]